MLVANNPLPETPTRPKIKRLHPGACVITLPAKLVWNQLVTDQNPIDWGFHMDRGQFIKSLRELSPIIIAGIASTLNTVAFVVDVIGNKLDSQKLAITVLVSSLLSTVLLWGFSVIYIQRRTRSSRAHEFSVLDSEDIFELDDQGNATHKRLLTFKVNQESQFYLLYSPDVSGTQSGVKAYQANNPNLKYEVFPRKSRKVLLVDLGHTLRKNEKVTGLCLEWQLHRSFTEEYETVTVSCEPGQERCVVRVVLPQGTFSLSADWYCSYHRSLIPLQRGPAETTRDINGKHIISHDFGPQQEKEPNIDLTCSISWQWERSTRDLSNGE